MYRIGLLITRQCLLAILSIVVLGRVDAASITLIPTADTCIFEKAPFNNVGGAWSFAAGDTATSDHSRALVKFEVASALPENARITSARLELTVVRAIVLSSSIFESHRLLVDWGEGDKNAGFVSGVGATASTGEASWMARRHPSTFWSEPGAAAGSDYVAEASAAGSVGSGTVLTFASAPGSIADVQAWLDSPASNFGWLIKDQLESGETSARRFGSREHPDSPPLLHLEYEMGTPQLRIAGAELNGADFCLRFTATAGKSYVVERRGAVDAGLWTTVSNLPPATATQEVIVCEPLGATNCFYRVGEQ
jgi:hypothetical protein